jgi:hypothetical protein
MGAFSQPPPSNDTGVVGKFEQAKELQRARLAGYASDVPDNTAAPASAGANSALNPPSAPTMGTPAPQGATMPPPSAPMPQTPNVAPPPVPLAQGTIVTKPTLAVLGEGGNAEAVIPLNNNPDNKTSMNMVMPHGRYQRR